MQPKTNNIKAPEEMSMGEIFELLTDEEKRMVISYAEQLKAERHTP